MISNFKKISTMAMCALFGTMSGFAFNAHEKEAQSQVNAYLQKNYTTKIHKEDNSVNFVVRDNIFWITFKGDANGIIYTLHRRPIKLKKDGQSKEALNRVKEDALFAAQAITANKPYKAYLKNNQVEFEFPVAAATPADYTKIFPRVLRILDEVSMDGFTQEMKQAQLKTDSIHKYWQEHVPNAVIVSQPKEFSQNMNQAGGVVIVSDPLVHSINRMGVETTPYNAALYQDKVKFLQVKAKMRSDKQGTYQLGLKIVNPDGKVLLPSKSATQSVTLTTELTKKDKEIEFPPFGASESNMWKPGKYIIIFTADGKEVNRFTINII